MKKILLPITLLCAAALLSSCMSLMGLKPVYTATTTHMDVDHNVNYIVSGYMAGKNAEPRDIYYNGNNSTTISYTAPKGMHWICITTSIDNVLEDFDIDINKMIITTDADNQIVPVRSSVMTVGIQFKGNINTSPLNTKENPSTAKTLVPFLVTVPHAKKVALIAYYLVNDKELPATLSLFGTVGDLTSIPKPAK